MLGTLILWGCQGESPDPAARRADQKSTPSLPQLDAEVLEVQPIVWPRSVRAQGTLIADEEAVIGAKIPGRVSAVHVDLGQQVSAGTELISIDREDLKLQIEQVAAQLQQARTAVGLPIDAPLESLNPTNSPPVREAQAVLDEARVTRARVERLHAQNAITEAEWQQALAAEKVAVAQLASATNSVNEKIAMIHVRVTELALARQRFADAAMLAPFDGLVLERHVAPGSYVQTGQAVITLVRINPLRFRATLPERFAGDVRIGQTVQVRVNGEPLTQTSTITRISPALDAASRALLFESDLENHDGRLRAGLFGEADVVLDPQQTAVVVPLATITEFAGMEKVWKVEAGKSIEQQVRVGNRRGDLVEILEGLAAGDQVLLNGDMGKPAMVTITASRRLDSPGTRQVTPEVNSQATNAESTVNDDASAAGP